MSKSTLDFFEDLTSYGLFAMRDLFDIHLCEVG